MKPVMYLDIDGVLWDVDISLVGRPGILGEETFKGANGLEGFITWALENFEVRWLSAWAMGGNLNRDGHERLARYTGVPANTWAQVGPNLGWSRNKCQGINWDEHRKEGRPFVWIEDGLLPQEMQSLLSMGLAHRYYHTDVFADPNALIKTQAMISSLMDRGGLEPSA